MPERLLIGITSTLVGRGLEDIDMIVVRENVEGELFRKKLLGSEVY